jgi:methionyl-tRNA synthetase
MKNTRYLTTPLYYVNARPHIGHSYTTILADILKRHHLQRGEGVTFLTGTDEHGEKIEQMARNQGRDVREFVNEVSADFRSTWEKMGLAFDIFYRTTDTNHIRQVQHALQTLKDKGDIVFREFEGNYCVGCERFVTDTELTPDGLCPDHLKKPEPRREANYFFLMSRYQKALIHHYETQPQSIRPEHYRQEILSFLKQPLGDLCISRPKSRLQWGIELPFDSQFVTYVWFDALLNYLIATGWPGTSWKKELWAETTHLIAKDILKAHAVYWPTLLMALEVPLFKGIVAHGYWLIDGAKMSKSLGNVLRPLEVEEKFGEETLRFHLLREMSFGIDATFTLESYINGINAYLANGIGNLASRVMTLCQKNFHGELHEDSLLEADRALLAKRQATLAAWDQGFDDLKFQNSLKAWSELVTAVDLYVNEMKPWALAKDPAASARLQTVLGVCLRMLQTLAVLIYPVMPKAAVKLLCALGEPTPPGTDVRLALADRTRFELSSEVPKLFMRVQMPVDEAAADAASAEKTGKAGKAGKDPAATAGKDPAATAGKDKKP